MFNNLIGQTLGKYELRALLGAGGMGAVYRAYDHSLQREVAVKVINLGASNDELQARFIREARTAASLEHSHIVRVYDYGVERDINYIVMQNLTGGALSERMKQASEQGRPRASLPDVALLLEQLASALDYAHAQGVIHRDIKPQNVMFNNQGLAFLVDFGIAKLLTGATNMTGTGMAMGTPSYMSPEQWASKEIGPAADQYALAVMTYQLIAGRLPFEADTPLQVMYKHMNDQPTPLSTFRPDVPSAVLHVMNRALAKEPTERFPNCTQFAQAFASAVVGVPESRTEFFTFKLAAARPSGAPYTPTPNRPAPSTPPPAVRTPSLPGIPLTQQPKTGPSRNVLFGAAAALVVIGILAVLLLSNRGPSEAELRLTDVGQTLVAAGLATDRIETREAGLELIATETPEPTATNTETPDPTATDTPTDAPTATETVTATNTASPSVTTTLTATATDTASPASTPTTTPSPTSTATATATSTPSLSPREAALATLDTGATQTATLWTPTSSATFTPTEDYQATVRAELTAVFNEGLTATATLWTATQSSTLTSTQSPTLTFTGTPPPTLPITDRAPSLSARVDANVRLGDSTVYPVVDSLLSGQSAPILGIADSGWYYIELSNGRRGFIAPSVVTINGSLENVPFIAAPTVIATAIFTATHTQTSTYTSMHSPTPDPLAFARTPVTRNADWTPVEADFGGVPMMLVPAGCFDMGSDDGNLDERPISQICFNRPMWIDKYEVTNQMFGSIGCAQESWALDQPRNCVVWIEATLFCENRDARLPTEAEWEYAARGPDGLIYPWGNSFESSLAIGQQDTTFGDSWTSPVGARPDGTSWVGTMDMSGNVWEWTSSPYMPYPYRLWNEIGTDTSGHRIARGGSFTNDARELRSTDRLPFLLGYDHRAIGFRCARDFDESDLASVASISPEPTSIPIPTSSGLVAAPTTSGEPVVHNGVDLFVNCDDPPLDRFRAPANLATGSTVEVFWYWYARTQEQIQQHLDSAQYDITINGQSIHRPLEYAHPVRRQGNDYIVEFFYSTGALDAGTYVIEYRVAWSESIFDGYMNFGPGTNIPEETGTCTFVVR